MQDNRTEGDRRNWIPAPFQQAAQKIAADAVKQFLTEEVRVVGLGSGPMAAAIIQEISKLPYKENLQCIATSTQIKLETAYCKLKIVDEDLIPEVEVVFDGADQIDKKSNMIKGGGGALLKEKILHSADQECHHYSRVDEICRILQSICTDRGTSVCPMSSREETRGIVWSSETTYARRRLRGCDRERQFHI